MGISIEMYKLPFTNYIYSVKWNSLLKRSKQNGTIELSQVIEQQNEQVQWRRNKVQEIRKGYSQREISQILIIGLPTVKRLSYLRNQAKPNIRKYIDEGRYRTRKVLRSRKENL